MINFNPFPTDNLYKFLALSGLLIAVFSAYYSFQLIAEYGIDLINYTSRLEKGNANANFLFEELKELVAEYERNDRKLEHIVKDLKKANTDFETSKITQKEYLGIWALSEKDIKELNLKSETLAAINKKQRKLELELEIERISNNQEWKLIEGKQQSINEIKILSAVGAGIGLALSMFGFKGWVKLQIAMDRHILSPNITRKLKYRNKSFLKRSL